MQRLKPVRVVVTYGERHGPLLAAGLSYQALFAAFASLWVSFAVAGIALGSDPAARLFVIDVLDDVAPGLIDNGSGGAIDPELLLEAQVLGWTGAVALVGLVITALNWLASGRDAVRTIFELPAAGGNQLLMRLADLGVGAALGAGMLLTGAMSVLSTAALSAALAWAGIDPDSLVVTLAARLIGIVLIVALDALVLVALLRLVARVRVPRRRLIPGVAIGAAALGGLQVLGSTLVGGTGGNPLLAGFAVIVGLLVWFNLTCHAILLSATWIAVGLADARSASSQSVGADQ